MKPEKINTEFVAVQHYSYDGLIKDWHTLDLLREIWNSEQDIFTKPEITELLLGIRKDDEDD